MNLKEMLSTEKRRKLKMTVLHREDGEWHQSEIEKLTCKLVTRAIRHPRHPQLLVLFGHHEKGATLEVIGSSHTHTVIEIVGTYSDKLPFVPEFD